MGIEDVSYNGPGGSKPLIPEGRVADEVEYEPYGRAMRRVEPAADWNGSGATDVADIFAFLSSWFTKCSGPGEALVQCPSPAIIGPLCEVPPRAGGTARHQCYLPYHSHLEGQFRRGYGPKTNGTCDDLKKSLKEAHDSGN